MKTPTKLLVGTTLLALSLACNRQAAPCPQTATNQASPAAVSSPTIDAPAMTETENNGPSYKPKRGYVPDEKTAIAIAVAVWNPIYGKKQIESEKPFHASLRGGVWTVTGSLPEGWVGGTAIAEIAQNDGRVLRVIHEQ